MRQSTFHIAGMCCPREEQLVRNRLAAVSLLLLGSPEKTE